MTDIVKRDFPRFARERLLPVARAVHGRKKSAFRTACAVAAALFIIFGGVTYLFLAPYREMLDGHGILYWPVVFLVPLSLAMVGFSIVYIISLRQVVSTFRKALIERLGEYVDPGLAYEPNQSFPQSELEASLLFIGLGTPISGKNRFRGPAGPALAEFGDIAVKQAAGSDTKPGMSLNGLFFTARFPARFKSMLVDIPASANASLSGIGAKLRELGDYSGELLRLDDGIDRRQLVVPVADNTLAGQLLSSSARKNIRTLHAEQGSELFLACRADRLYIAILTNREKTNAPADLDGFDTGHCREFCDEAITCINLAREIGARRELFAE